MLSTNFEVDVPTGKVGSSLFFSRQRRKLRRGSGGMPPPPQKKISTFRCLEILFSTFSRQYINQTILTTFYVYYNLSFPQNLNYWLLEKSEMINLQMLIQKNTFHVLSSYCPFKKTFSAMSTLVSLVGMPFWHKRKPGI